ncbi:unnamed protein product [Spirodela intermedia]|uniref:Uncharacterized protein n=1 Tax=Spirodela intermedia TaxID=51605 RepID=A0A7I8KLY0_SPIIN|nr:unnamed protein product [Spirodela intermedia]
MATVKVAPFSSSFSRRAESPPYSAAARLQRIVVALGTGRQGCQKIAKAPGVPYPPPPPLLLGENFTKVGAIAVLSASLLFVDPSLAFRGGGPYGQEVTRGQDLTGKDFSGKNLTKQDFKTSILRQATFKGATLIGASFFDADLTGADLSDSDLRGADFSLANVTKANLSNANLEGALTTGNTSFRGSNITGAVLEVTFKKRRVARHAI